MVELITNTTKARGAGTRAVRGMVVNLKSALALAFQVNPMQIEVDKRNNWDIDTPVGFEAPIVTWVSGAEKHIRFDLFFDGTKAGVESGISLFSIPFTGVRGQIAVLESFLAPQVPVVDIFKRQNIMNAPPDVFLIIGLRFWRCKLISAPIQEILHDKFLTPMRILSALDFIVLEEGSLHRVNVATRRTLAALESTAGFINTNLSVLFSR